MFVGTGAVALAGESINAESFGVIESVDAERYIQVKDKWKLTADFENKDDVVFYVYEIQDEAELIDEVRKVLVTRYVQDINSADVEAVLNVPSSEWDRTTPVYDPKKEEKKSTEKVTNTKKTNDSISSDEYDRLMRLLLLLIIQSLIQQGDIDTEAFESLLEVL